MPFVTPVAGVKQSAKVHGPLVVSLKVSSDESIHDIKRRYQKLSEYPVPVKCVLHANVM